MFSETERHVQPDAQAGEGRTQPETLCDVLSIFRYFDRKCKKHDLISMNKNRISFVAQAFGLLGTHAELLHTGFFVDDKTQGCKACDYQATKEGVSSHLLSAHSFEGVQSSLLANLVSPCN